VLCQRRTGSAKRGNSRLTPAGLRALDVSRYKTGAKPYSGTLTIQKVLIFPGPSRKPKPKRTASEVA